MSKRRRTNSGQDEELNDEAEPEQSPVLSNFTRKRKKLDPSELCQHLYDSIRNIKKEDGSMLCDTFIRAPKRRQAPSYYEVVTNPIDLLRVQQKLKTDSYEDIEELAADVELLVNNAKAFYKPESTEYQDACVLWETFNKNKAALVESISEEGSGSTEPKSKRVSRFRKSGTHDDDNDSTISKDDDFDTYEELFTTVMNSTDPMQDNRLLCTQFQLLPSKKLYPDYYDIIEHPIDLKFIATKIQTSAYLSLNELEKDFLQMAKNACTFNEPGSQIYKDAKALKKIFIAKKQDIESGKYKPTTKARRRGQSLSAITAALKEVVESSDEELDDLMESDVDGPLWQLFDQLYNTANSTDHNGSGAPLGEALWKLPNRRFHPEYYTTIKKPISMAQIRNKLKKGEYSNITEMTADLYLMIDNARKAHPPTHKVYKDAVKMQKILNQKLVDTGLDQESDMEDCCDLSIPSIASTANSSPSTPTPGIPSTLPKKKGRPRIHPLPIGTTTPQVTTPVASVSPQIPSSSLATPKGRFPNNPALKKKLLGLQKFLTEYTVAGRRPMAMFMEKPSKKLYPDYYEVIQHPMDMNTIESNIKSDRYGTVDDVVGDYRLMFSNCRKYNEEKSQIYEDANILERALNEKLKEFSGLQDRRLTPKIVKRGSKNLTPMDQKLRQLYDAIRDYRDAKTQRQLALIFMKLPSKNDYPDYYDIIKTPIDMEKIAQKLKTHFYDNVDEMASDFMLMFENACKYNEPDSQIYKDALVLQQVCIQTKQKLNIETDNETVPDVKQTVQELLLSLFTTFYNHQDEEGRCFSDSLAELAEYDDIDGNKIRAISLDLIKRRLDKGLYKRLDIFQEDLFSCLDRARRLSRTDSQVFEDSIELQSFFIKKRDELCRFGEVLKSPALSYSALHLSAAVEAVRQSKLLQEEQEQEQETDTTTAQGESMTIDQQVYSPGDFVLYEMPENKIPGIAYIERLWTNSEGVKMMYGNIFLRPYETYHVATRKFLEQEVFKCDQHQPIPLSSLRGKCFVMNVKDYFKMQPEGFTDQNVFVCESRYNSRARGFKKIKTWPFTGENNSTVLVNREVPLEPKRIQSVFKERVEKHKGELAELQLQEAIIEKEKPNVAVIVQGSEEGHTYFEQYNTICSSIVKTGDYVYVATETGKQSIAQINSIWETKDGKSYFRGPWLLTPPEINGVQNKYFYRQEVLLSTVQETSPIIAIVGRCSVLELEEYVALRPTEIAESDVYVCESTYDEFKKQIRKTVGGLRRFTHSQMVTPDEIYHFPRSISPVRVSASEIAALQDNLKPIFGSVIDSDIKYEGPEIMMDDSMDGGGPPSVGSDLAGTSSPAASFVATPGHGKKNKGPKKMATGFILYSSSVRKRVIDKNPDCTFGDISRLVGNEWRSLPLSERQEWEEKAVKLNEENKAFRLANEDGVSPSGTLEPHPNLLYECCWEKCDWQFEDASDCLDHCVAEGIGHVQRHFSAIPTAEIEYTCQWRGCIRVKKQMPAFPHLQRLVKHVRDVHINKSGGRVISPHDRSKNYMPSRRVRVPMSSPGGNSLNHSGSILNSAQPAIQIQAAPVEPMFITVPPRPQRVLHSEAYIKYIEGLQAESRYISPWEKTLKASQDKAQTVDVAKLPTHWFGPNATEKVDDVVGALWQLRNFMMKDVIQLQRHEF